jgi:hypothetical protein
LSDASALVKLLIEDGLPHYLGGVSTQFNFLRQLVIEGRATRASSHDTVCVAWQRLDKVDASHLNIATL